MRILVVGVGKLGMMLAENLSKENHDVVVIDSSEDVIQRCEDALDVLCIRGNGCNASVLLEAGVDKADIIISTTATDEINMLCSLMAKRLGARYAIARIRDPENEKAGAPVTACVECGACLEKCPQKIDIPTKLKEVDVQF